MSRWVGAVRICLILAVLVAAVVVPVIASGYLDASRAQQALANKDYAGAADSYESAAWKLPWKPELLEKAAIAMANVNGEGAISLFEQVRARGALSASGWNKYGAVYWASGQDKAALDIWLTGLQDYPSHDEFYYLIHLAYRGLGKFTEERAWLEKWLTAGKGRAADHYELGLLLMASDAVRARTELALAAGMDATFAPAVKSLDASLDLAGRESDNSRRLVLVGRALGLVNQWPLAQHAFEQAVEAGEQNADAWAWLGEARQENGKDGKPELDKALSLNGDSTLVHALRGLYWKRQAKYTAQLAEYIRSAQLEPQNPEWQAALGGAYELKGDLVFALASYQKATSLAPDNPIYWRLLAMFSADNGVQVLDVGLPAAKKAAQLAPDDALAMDALGWTFAQAGLLHNAEETLIKATSLAPGSTLAHYHLAQTYLLQGDQKSALAEFSLVGQLDPDGPMGALAKRMIQQYFP